MLPSQIMRERGKANGKFEDIHHQVCLMGAWGYAQYSPYCLPDFYLTITDDFNRSVYGQTVLRIIEEKIGARITAFTYSDQHSLEDVLDVMEKTESELGLSGVE